MVLQFSATQVGTAFFQIKDRRAGIDDAKVGELVVDVFNLHAPTSILVYFIDEERLAAMLIEFQGEIVEPMGGEIEIVDLWVILRGGIGLNPL